MIEVAAISKRFGAVVAIDQVSFTARDGEITGLVGPNVIHSDLLVYADGSGRAVQGAEGAL